MSTSHASVGSGVPAAPRALEIVRGYEPPRNSRFFWTKRRIFPQELQVSAALDERNRLTNQSTAFS
jgi:hypothetical protein